MKKTKSDIEEEIFREIPQFERFFKIVGFKRIDGTLYGYLALSESPRTSEEISNALGLSQSAVSQGVSRLSHWGAIESQYDAEKRAQAHQATVDQIRLVATIFLKREKEAIANFKAMAERSIELCQQSDGTNSNSIRMQRLRSIVLTCQAAETVMDFVIDLSKSGAHKKYAQVFGALPRALELLSETKKMEQRMSAMASQVRSNLEEKFLLRRR